MHKTWRSWYTCFLPYFLNLFILIWKIVVNVERPLWFDDPPTGIKNRSIGVSNVNQHSSRSHWCASASVSSLSARLRPDDTINWLT